MAEPLKALDNQKGHRTKAEKAARKRSESALSRDKVALYAPARVKSDIVAARYWRDTIRRMRGISLLDNLDTDMLASYCLQCSIRDVLSLSFRRLPLDETLKSLQSQERLILSYANKLGLTPESRMRLAKKASEERPVDPDADMFGGG
jgi:phage terminase small subunit